MGDTANDDLGGCRKHLTGWRNAVAEPFDEKLSVGIEHDLDDSWIVEGDTELVAEGILELADQAGVRAELGHGIYPGHAAQRVS